MIAVNRTSTHSRISLINYNYKGNVAAQLLIRVSTVYVLNIKYIQLQGNCVIMWPEQKIADPDPYITTLYNSYNYPPGDARERVYIGRQVFSSFSF